MYDQGCRRVNGESQRRSARDVEREMGADVDTGQPHQGNGGQGEGPARRAEPGQGGGAKGDGDGSVPGQVTETGSVPTTAAGPRKQRGRAGAAHYLLDQFRQRPGASAADEEPTRQLAVSGQPRRSGSRGHGTEGAHLHDDPGGRVQRIRQAVGGPEGSGLPGAHAVVAHGTGRGQQRRDAHAEPDPGIGQRLTE